MASTRTHLLRPLAVVALTVLASAGVACGSSGSGDEASTDTSATSESTSWSFTDSNGTTHELDQIPQRIVAQSTIAGGLWEYGIVAAGVIGPMVTASGAPDSSIGLAPPEAFTSISDGSEEPSAEAIAALDPDIIVVPSWGDNGLWGISDAVAAQLESRYPIVEIRVDNRLMTEPLELVAALAESLGADPATANVPDAKGAFEQASDRLSGAVAANPGLRVAAASGTTTEMYVAYAPAFPDLAYYQELGMEFVEPAEHDTAGGFWETLSWEEADKYPADLLLIDARTGTLDELIGQMPAPAKALPAVEAGQMTSWKATTAIGYGYVAQTIDELTAAVSAARPGIA